MKDELITRGDNDDDEDNEDDESDENFTNSSISLTSIILIKRQRYCNYIDVYVIAIISTIMSRLMT